ncbi:LuxR family transcriptional regulator [Mesorhizobium sp. SARCC-RB16n]|uniref:helix-turn-helix transcriptional regulator n=1 Tax=Mesorhizobium sp. SARCC-RB16n TaxID=2116687 RepID=UPI00122EBB44|nr:LuxR family transcriptional regulator [Mesorhizobium sp. SARCC-RB16n]KAA3448419.1 LuxR family transcriptional regulator [Mesorhizobium sp. SARCC-RB16n]
MPFQSSDPRDAFALEFGRFIEHVNSTARSELLFGVLRAFAMKFDYPWIAYGSPTAEQRCLEPPQYDPMVMLNYPTEWQERCSQMGYGKLEPTVKTSRARLGVFRWSEVYTDASTTREERHVFDEAAAFGLTSGITVPLHGPDGHFAIMSFAQPRNRDFQHGTIAYLQLAASHFHLQFARSRVYADVPNLTRREKECILWASRGKSSWETGMIMRISLNTVNFHLKNAMRKLDASNRTVAAMKAVRFGIIE